MPSGSKCYLCIPHLAHVLSKGQYLTSEKLVIGWYTVLNNPCINRYASAQVSLQGGENIRGNFNTDYLPRRIFSPVIFIYIFLSHLLRFLKWATAAGELVFYLSRTSSWDQKITSIEL